MVKTNIEMGARGKKCQYFCRRLSEKLEKIAVEKMFYEFKAQNKENKGNKWSCYWLYNSELYIDPPKTDEMQWKTFKYIRNE